MCGEENVAVEQKTDAEVKPQIRDFTKRIMPGGTGQPTRVDPEPCPVTCEITYRSGSLSIVGDCYGGSGQIDMHFAHKTAAYDDNRYSTLLRLTWFDAGWTEAMWQQFLDIWHDWHLNDMRAGCIHQTPYLRQHPQLLQKQLEVVRYTLGDAYYELKRDIGERSQARDEDGFMRLTRRLWKIENIFKEIGLAGWTTKRPQLWPESARQLMTDGFIKADGLQRRDKAACISPDEHEDGWLSRPCPECGHKYGHGWNFEAVPEDVIEFLARLPDATFSFFKR